MDSERGAPVASRVAEGAVATWNRVYAASSPIIGARGMCALYQRSLHLACPEFPWLGEVHATATDSGDFDALRLALSQQPGAVSAAACDCLLKIFVNLLAQLIGESLTARLLGNVFNDTSNGSAVTDESDNG